VNGAYKAVWSVRIGRTARELKVDESLITGLYLDFVVLMKFDFSVV
jgi:hypothetical protein